MEARSLQTEALVEQYVHVVNDSMGRNEDQTPWKQILAAVKSATGDDVEAGVAIYKDDPDHPEDHFVLGWRDGRLDTLQHGKDDDHTWWNMPRKHLEDVVENPKPYLENPAKFDLDWMSRRLGLQALTGDMMPN